MKKFIFSAVAVMAFSVGSMANTVESINYSKSDSFDENQGCYDRSLVIGIQAGNAGYNDDEITWYMNVFIAICMGYSMQDVIDAGYTTQQ